MLKDAPIDIKVLFDLKTIRIRSRALFERAAAGESSHFKINRNKLDEAASYVSEITRKNYPDLKVPFHSRWRHFEGSRAYIDFINSLSSLSSEAKLRAKIDLAVVSVLLDAGAGSGWAYKSNDGKVLSRSEGLAVASLEAFLSGKFGDSFVSAKTLSEVTSSQIASFFQVTDQNLMIGVDGRASILSALGNHVLASGANSPSDFFSDLFQVKEVSIQELFSHLVQLLFPIWPKRYEMDGINLGDTWEHRALNFGGKTGRLIPFHKLTQWLTYSIIEPFEEAGIHVTGIEALTPLPEYRNGGLLIDLGVITCKGDSSREFMPQEEFIVELRALTIRLIDELSVLVRDVLTKEGLSTPLPLAAILQGGTWSAGRAIALEKRKDGSPPFLVKSDGTVF